MPSESGSRRPGPDAAATVGAVVPAVAPNGIAADLAELRQRGVLRVLAVSALPEFLDLRAEAPRGIDGDLLVVKYLGENALAIIQQARVP